MKIIKGGITAPLGYKAAGIAAGIKSSGGKDLALIVSDVEAAACGMFTSNRVKAAPVLLSIKNLKGRKARVIIANAGNANACNGKKGMDAAIAVAKGVSETLRIKANEVLVASTGTIGVPFPAQKVLSALKTLSKKLSVRGGGDAADAILTTDTRRKEIAVQIKVVGKPVRIGGIAKGAGMINPELKLPHATMFCFISTDANIKSSLLSKALNDAVSDSFNMVTIDNDRSTNDTIFALANGASGCEVGDGSREYKKFVEALKFVCTYLAKEIARDGEGATKLIEIRVAGAKSESDARLVAKTIAGSNLFKAAAYGADPNWGRVMAALGYSGAQVGPDKIDVSIGGIKVVRSGGGVPFNKSLARKYLSGKEIVYSVGLNQGKYKAVAWGCDLSYDYVKINAEYHT